MQNQTPIEAKISNIKARIANLYDCHEHADGKAYSDFCEKAEIDKLKEEMAYWERLKRLDEEDRRKRA